MSERRFKRRVLVGTILLFGAVAVAEPQHGGPMRGRGRVKVSGGQDDSRRPGHKRWKVQVPRTDGQSMMNGYVSVGGTRGGGNGYSGVSTPDSRGSGKASAAASSQRAKAAAASDTVTDVGNIDWQVNGTTVSGTVTDDAGAQLASFSGSITAGATGGTYTAATGESGDWSWEPAAPAP